MNHLEKIAGYSRSVTDRKRCDGNKRPWKPNARLKRSGQDIGRQEKRKPLFNQYHRQMLDPLRDRDWVPSSKLPDHPGTTLALLRNGWMERRC
jgi:hypothetical protein